MRNVDVVVTCGGCHRARWIFVARRKYDRTKNAKQNRLV